MKSINYLSKESCYVDDDVIFGDDVVIYPAVVIEKNVIIGNKVIIQTGVMIENNVKIGANVQIQSGSIIKNNVKLGNNIFIGPNSLIRDNTTIDDDTMIGPNCEIRNSQIGSNVIIGHQNFIGDAKLCDGVEFGFGAVTANYSNNKYWRTTINSKTKIGCNAVLIAPVSIGKNSIIGAGSVITKDVLDNSKVIQKRLTIITKFN